MHGRESLPPAWLADLELREVIERMAMDLHATFVLGLEPDSPANGGAGVRSRLGSQVEASLHWV